MHIWLEEALESMIQQEMKQVRVVHAKWTDDLAASSLARRAMILLYCSDVNWLER